MNYLSKHIYTIIHRYNSSIATMMIYKTCTYYKTLLQNEKDNITELKDYLCELYNNKIINLIGGIGQMLEYPILEWNKKFLGSTGYIDNIDVDSVSDKMMRGIDGWGRPFITLRIKNDNDNRYCKKKTYICVLFQRYTDSKTSWTHGTLGGLDIITESGHFMNANGIYHTHLIYNMYNLVNDKGFIYRTNISNNIETIDGIRLV